MTPPIAKKIEKILSKHNDIRIDNYYWLNERENQDVIKYLEDENIYTQSVLAHTKTFQEQLFSEMKARIKEDDSSVPQFTNGYFYQTKYVVGGEYPIYLRKKNLNAEEEILFDVNEMAKDFSYYELGSLSVSPSTKLATFGVDTLSRRIYSIQIKNLETGEILPDLIENTTGSAVWAADNQTIFYVRKDEALRPFQVWKHILGTNANEDVLIYEEKDETFSVYVYKSKSREYIIIGSSSTVSDEFRYISSNQPDSDFTIFQNRERDLEYSVEHFQNDFFIQTNKDEADNFKLMKTPLDKTSKDNWKEVIPHREDVLLEGFEIFESFLVLEERTNGLVQFNVKPWDSTKKTYLIPFSEETYTVSGMSNPEFNTTLFRFYYSSMTTPASVIDFDLEQKTTEVKKVQEVQGDFSAKDYVTKRLWATARDGEKVPMSIVYHKNTIPSENTPLLLYAYGSYGHTIDAYFSTTRLSLLNRGFIYVIAHIRGGEYLGRNWYEDGKMLQKKNTFFDFIDVAKYLISENYTSPNHLYAMGGSAGGLLMGAVINYNPELFHGVIAAVPFVDVVTTMLDESIPLTTGEYDEWGNPNDKEYYDYMKSYSPYDNVEAKAYPNLLVTTGLHDSQVQYWEPAKWVAKLREFKTNDSILVLHTNMETGHGGASGRFESLKETAMEFAFILDLENIKN